MTGKVRQVLDQIDAVLAEGSDDSRRLWDIMTALRGPDHFENQGRKDTGTIYIRQAAFPTTAKSANWWYASINPNPNRPLDPEYNETNYEFTHFEGHLQRGIDALDLRPKAEA